MKRGTDQQVKKVPLQTVCVMFAVTLVHLVVIALVTMPSKELQPRPVVEVKDDLIESLEAPFEMSAEATNDEMVEFVLPQGALSGGSNGVEDSPAVALDETFVDLPALPREARPSPPSPQS